MKEKISSHRELVELSAAELGTHREIDAYKKHVWNQHHVAVSSSTVVKTLGSRWARCRTNKQRAEKCAKNLLSECQGSFTIARLYLKQAKVAAS